VSEFEAVKVRTEGGFFEIKGQFEAMKSTDRQIFSKEMHKNL